MCFGGDRAKRHSEILKGNPSFFVRLPTGQNILEVMLPYFGFLLPYIWRKSALYVDNFLLYLVLL